MKIPSTLKSIIYKCDLFSTNIGFRFKQQRQYASMTGGVISILMIVFFIAIFTNTGVSTMNKQYIISVQNKKISQDPDYLTLSKDRNFYFTLGLTGIDMNTDIRYFDITMTNSIYYSTKKIKTKAALVPCQRQVWQKFNSTDILSAFDTIGLSKWLCPPQDSQFQFKGKFTSQQFKFVKFGVQKCKQATDPSRRCATNSEINDFLSKNQVFTLNYYFINTMINPQQKDYIKYYLQDKNYFPFTLTQGLTANIYISSYSVNTDQSLLPNENLQRIDGGLVSQNAQMFPYYVTGVQYLKFYLRKSSQEYIFNRSFKKLDDTLSYIGGLFSSLLTFLAIVCFYNQLSYELQIARSIYRYDKDTLLDTNGFHFLNYLTYLAYFMLKALGCQLKWDKMEHYDKSLNQVRKQMDVRLIYKKILFTQKLADALLSPEQLMALHLQDKLTISQAEQIRQNYFIPKLLIQELQENKIQRKNPLENRLHTENNDDDTTSKALTTKQLPQNAKQERHQVQFENDQFEQNSENRCIQNRTNYEINKQMITNSISDISQKGKDSHIYIKLVKIINRLIKLQSQGDCISKKILKGISPQIRQILSIQSLSHMQPLSIIDFTHLDRKKNNKPPSMRFRRGQTFKNVNTQIDSVKSSSQKKLKLKLKIKNEQFKQINDIIIVQDYLTPPRQTLNNSPPQ